MNIIIYGPHVFSNQEYFERVFPVIPRIKKKKTLVHCGSYGVEAMACEWARERGWRGLWIEPRWQRDGPLAYFRNYKRMVKRADCAVVLNDGKCSYAHALIVDIFRAKLPHRIVDVVGHDRKIT